MTDAMQMTEAQAGPTRMIAAAVSAPLTPMLSPRGREMSNESRIRIAKKNHSTEMLMADPNPN